MMGNLSILKQFLAIGAMLFLVTSCEKNELETDPSAQQLESEIPIPPSYEVAKIQKDGHEYTFEAIGEENEMVVLEKLYGVAEENEENSGIAESETPFEAFISITDDHVKVPLRIAETVDETVIEASNREIDASSSLLEILDPNYNAEIEERACNDIGYSSFRNNYCGGSSSSNSDIRWCDAGLRSSWFSRNSKGYQHKKVRTWTHVASGACRIRIGEDKGGYFPVWIYQKTLNCATWWVNVFPNTYQRRVVYRMPASNGGTFRSYTRFSN